MKRMIPWLVGCLLTIPLAAPLFGREIFIPHDYTHAVRLAELERTIMGGAFPPRWSENLGFGYGLPLFSFYAPLPYYLGLIIHWLGFSWMTTVTILFAATFLASYLSMYYLIKEFWRPAGALVGAALFVYAPYRAVDVYVRGALGELFGILFIVLSLFMVVKLVKTGALQWWIGTALATAGLMLSHNLMAFIGFPFVLVTGMLFSLKTNQRLKLRSAMPVLTGLAVGVGLAAYYVFPAIFEKNYTSVDQLTQGEGSYTHHFVYLRQFIRSPFGYGGSISGPFDGMSFEIGWLHLTVAALAGMGVLLSIRSRRIPLSIVYWLAVLGLSIYLMTAHSLPVWQLFTPLKYLQFPWRLLIIPMITIPLAGGFVFDRLYRLGRTPRLMLITVFLISLIVSTSPLFHPNPEPNMGQDPAMAYSTTPRDIQTFMSTVLPDYIHPRLAPLVLSKEKVISPPAGRFVLQGNPAATYQVMENRAQTFRIHATVEGDATLTANIFDFPGWRWYVDDKPVEHQVGEPLPVMSVQLSSASPRVFEIRGVLEETPLRLGSDLASICSMILIGFVGSIMIFSSHGKLIGRHV